MQSIREVFLQGQASVEPEKTPRAPRLHRAPGVYQSQPAANVKAPWTLKIQPCERSRNS